MRSIYLFTILFTLFQFNTGFSQSPDQNSFYQGGKFSFYRDFAEANRYWDKTQLGTSIIIWEVSDGKLSDLKIFNPLSQVNQDRLTTVMDHISANWVQLDTAVTFYLPIRYSTRQDQPSIIE